MASRKQNGICYSANGCKRKFDSFLLKNKDKGLLKELLAVMMLEDFVPTKHFRICGDHLISSVYYPHSCMILKTSVPSVFDFPQQLEKVVTKRRQFKKKSLHIEGEIVNEGQSSLKYFNFSPSKAELKDIQKQKKRIKTLKQKVRWQQR